MAEVKYTFLKAIRPVSIYAMAHGLAPYTVHDNEITSTHFFNVYSLLILAIFSYTFYEGMYIRMNNYADHSNVETATDYFQLLGSIVSVTIMWLESIWSKKTIMKALLKVQSIDEKFKSRLNINIDYTKALWYAGLEFLLGNAIYFATVVYVLAVYNNRLTFTVYPVAFWLLYAVPLGLCIVRYLQMINMALVIWYHFTLLNKELLRIGRMCNDSNEQGNENDENKQNSTMEFLSKELGVAKNMKEIGITDSTLNMRNNWKNTSKVTKKGLINVHLIKTQPQDDFIKKKRGSTPVFFVDDYMNMTILENAKTPSLKPADKDEVFNLTSLFKRHSKIKDVAKNLAIKPTLTLKEILNSNIERLSAVCDLHDELCDISRLVDESYGFSNVANIGVAFTVITCQLYFVFTMIAEVKKLDVHFALASLVWVVPPIIQVVLLCAACHITAHEANQTGPVLHKIQDESTDAQFTDIVELFSLQLVHQTVKFTPCGFFNIDFTLLYAMIGGITTYLVILIQFHLSGIDNSNSGANSTIAPLDITTLK